ncbi:MAG: hypothetical protein ACFCVH_16170 [Alphaproteobacteria bacterium]
MRPTSTPQGMKSRRTTWLAALAAASVLVLCGCENLIARVEGGSETGVSNAEFGLTF